MKTLPLLFLGAFCLSATASDASEELWVRMQRAVLRDQSLDEVKAILDQGFDVNSPIGCGTFSAVDGALGHGDLRMLEFLLKAGARPKDLSGAAGYRNRAIAYSMSKALLEAGAGADKKGLATALCSASSTGNFEVVQLLLRQPGLEIDAPDVDAHTALMWAVQRGFEDIILALLESGADPRFKNARGESAADLAGAEIRKREEILKVITVPGAAEEARRAKAMAAEQAATSARAGMVTREFDAPDFTPTGLATTWREYFGTCGVTVSAGSEMAYDPKSKKLVVRNTPENFELIAAIFEATRQK